jgi:FH1/FH2 domain-containing protein 3
MQKQQDFNKSKEIIVLDPKRSNAINIAMTKLPPGRSIRAAILKMDSTVITREGIEKILNMMPTDEERERIVEAQNANPDMPLGSAEQFLSNLGSIAELHSRLKLWAFKLDFENIEKEIADPLMDLKTGIDILKQSFTFKCILSHLLSIGCFLNGQVSKGFQIDYLAKVSEVRDTVHKHSLLHHLCNMVLESNPNSTDLYSEIGPINRAAKADFCELASNIKYLERFENISLNTAQHTHINLNRSMNKFVLYLCVVFCCGKSISKPTKHCFILFYYSLSYTTFQRMQSIMGSVENDKQA